ncbi:endonuclease/exonuclease/phosphatase family protein [Ferruginibacter sp. SUN106]|uniref:endonuclease/exonuclease/phosphatase family protein n=1 Tax=Ferruginibacter sp. SUN106 TaxID=2978348 RepID=UPI003D36C9A4
MPNSLFRRLTKKFFIISNIILAVLFLLGCYGGLFNPQYWWPLGFLTLATFYLLLLLIVFIIFWIFVKPGWSLISFAAIILAYKPITNIVPLRFSSSFTQQKQAAAIRMMSWNVEHFDILEHKTHPEKKQEMLQLVNDYQPDIACFQEMVGSDSVPNAINYVPEMMQQMGMQYFNYSYNRKVDFDGNHHFGIITFSKYPIINKQTISYYPYDYNSIFQYTDIVKEADTFRVFNIHLQSLKFSSGNLKFIDNPEIKSQQDMTESKNLIYKLRIGFSKRKTQSERIKEEMNKSPYPVMVCGDFNDVPNSYAYTTIGKGLQNAFAEKGSGIGRTFTGISPTLRIDNIFVSDIFSVEQYTRIDKKLSDHFPIFADIQLKK